MFDWFKKRLARKSDGGWKEEWDSRLSAMETILGPSDPKIATSLMPIYLGGGCDVVSFRQRGTGVTYVTAGLTGRSAGQPPSSIGNYELMFCSREEVDWAAGMLSGLATSTLESVFNPMDTIDLGEQQPPGVTNRALLAMEPPHLKSSRFKVLGNDCGLLLLVGITTAELNAFRGDRTNEVLKLLGELVIPYTDLKRRSVL